MKSLLLALLIFFAFCSTINPSSAQGLEATSSIVNPRVIGPTLVYEIWARSSGTTADLKVGSSGFYHNFNTDALSNPSISEVNPRYSVDNPSGDYDITSGITGVNNNIFAVNIFFGGLDPATGELLSTSSPDGEKICTVTFSIVDASKTATITWDTGNSKVLTSDSQTPTQVYRGNIVNMSLIPMAPLPVSLTSFSASPQADGRVALKWATAMEINNEVFTLQRSTDAIHFTDVAAIPGAGTSLVPLNYTYQDEHPLSGTSYYRLKQKDFDGATTYSKVEAVKMEGTSLTINSAQPNPFQDRTVVNFSLLADTKVTFTLSDQMGNQVQRAEIDGLAGDNAFTISGEQLTDGIYFLHLITPTQKTSFKLIKGL